MLRVIWYSARKEDGGMCDVFCRFCGGEGIDIVSHYSRASRRICYCQWSGHISPVLCPDPRWGALWRGLWGQLPHANEATYICDFLLSSQDPTCLVLAVFIVLTHTVGARRSMARSSGTVVSAALWEGRWRTVILPLSISVLTIVMRGSVSRRGLLLGVRRNKEHDEN
jgi:hypothetical protein